MSKRTPFQEAVAAYFAIQGDTYMSGAPEAVLGFMEGLGLALRLATVAPEYFVALQHSEARNMPPAVLDALDGILTELVQRAPIAVAQ